MRCTAGLATSRQSAGRCWLALGWHAITFGTELCQITCGHHSHGTTKLCRHPGLYADCAWARSPFPSSTSACPARNRPVLGTCSSDELLTRSLGSAAHHDSNLTVFFGHWLYTNQGRGWKLAVHIQPEPKTVEAAGRPVRAASRLPAATRRAGEADSRFIVCLAASITPADTIAWRMSAKWCPGQRLVHPHRTGAGG